MLAPFKSHGYANPAFRAFSPSGLVPCLHDGDVVVWDSLAIAEYLAERHPGMWPEDATARAWARSIVCEMHSGFRRPAQRHDDVHPRARRRAAMVRAPLTKDIARIKVLWTEARRRFGEQRSVSVRCGSRSPMRSIAPVAFRFQTYGVEPEGVAGDYLAQRCSRIRWCGSGRRQRSQETAIVEADEPRILYRDKLKAAGRL